MSNVICIPELFKAVVDRMDMADKPWFDYGHYSEVTARLISKGNSYTYKGMRYPLIWLVMDFPERYSVGLDYYCELPDLQFIIATPTKRDSSTPKRMEDNFKFLLYPVYERFKKELVNSGFFHDLHETAIPHEKIDRPYWDGNDGTNKGNLFNDYIDAIQIRKMRLFVNETVPDKFRLLH